MILNPKYFHTSIKQDCLNCMATCREWYNHIPQFTQANWETFLVNSRGISQSQERNLGKHVNHVSFGHVQGDFLANMMQKLLDCECTEIESLEFDYGTSGTTEKEQDVFLNLLRRLASHRLTHLTLNEHNLNFSILDLLSVCPRLTNFSYRNERVSYRFRDYNEEPIQLLPYDQISYNALTYLDVQLFIPSIQYQVLSILHKTPNLKYFIDEHGSCEQRSQILITPELVLSLCSKFECYVDSCSYEGKRLIQNVLQQTPALFPTAVTTNSNNNSTGNNNQQQSLLQCLSLCIYQNENPIIFVLRKYKDTIKYLRLAKCRLKYQNNPSDWTRTFRTIPLQQLRTLYCDNINYTIESIITLLNTCCDTIQEVKLQHSLSEPPILDVPTLERLQTLPQLRILTIEGVTFVDEYSVVALFKRLPLVENIIFKQKESAPLPKEAALLLKNLKHLTLEETYIVGERETRLIGPLLVSPNFFVSLSQSGSKVESVTLKDGKNMYSSKGVGIPFLALHGLGTLPSLKFLDVRGIERNFNGERNEEKEEQYMLKFLTNFLCGCDNNLNSNITTVASPSKIEKLIIYDVSKLTYTMLNMLSDFQNLQQLIVSFAVDDDWDKIESPMPADSMFLNVDLYGVFELLRRCKTLLYVSLRNVKSCGERRPSYYLKKKLVEQQQNDTQLQKYSVFEEDFSNRGKNNIKLEHQIDISKRNMPKRQF